MFYYVSLICIFSVACANLSATAPDAPAQPMPLNRYAEIENVYAGMLLSSPLAPPASSKAKQPNPLATFPTLTYQEGFSLTLNKIKTFTESEDILPHTKTVSQDGWKNLELFTNEAKIAHKSVVGSIKRTYTFAGEVMLTRLLLDPLTDITLLRQRQECIKRIVEQPVLYRSIENVLTIFKKEEHAILSSALPQDPLNSPELEKVLSASLPAFADMSKHISAIFTLALMAKGGHSLFQASRNLYQNGTDPLEIARGTLGALGLTLPFMGSALSAPAYRRFMYVHGRLASLNQLFKTLDSIQGLVPRCGLPELEQLESHYRTVSNTPLAPLKKYLDTSTFRTVPSQKIKHWMGYLTTNLSNINQTLQQMKKCSAHILNGLSVIGLLDAYFSLARLIKEHTPSHAPWCFVDFESGSSRPHIKAEDVWHPVLNPATAITNSIEIGTPQNPQAIVITGVNTGGKTTFMKALALSCLLGQTVGIAPAKNFEFTPFARINTYLSITDDVSKNLSLFRAELARAQTLLKNMKQLPPDQFCITLLDEICTGTERVEGEALAYSVALKLGAYKNGITLLASHFPALSELASDHQELYRNMKVVVLKDEKNQFYFPYKLYPGATVQQIAPDLLEQAGLPLVMTQKMRDVLNNPERYTFKGE